MKDYFGSARLGVLDIPPVKKQNLHCYSLMICKNSHPTARLNILL
jgi:hypothetical protein